MLSEQHNSQLEFEILLSKLNKTDNGTKSIFYLSRLVNVLYK